MLPVCHGTIILGDLLKMDAVSNFLSLITVWEIGVRAAEREKPQTSEKDENTSKPHFENKKIKIVKSQYTILYSFNPALYSGQAAEEKTLWGSEKCKLCFHGIKNILRFPSLRA